MGELDNVIAFPAVAAAPLDPPSHLHQDAQQAWLDIALMSPRLARHSQALERAAVLLAHYRDTEAMSPSLTAEMNELLADLRRPAPATTTVRRYRRGTRPGQQKPEPRETATVVRPTWGRKTGS